MRWTFVTFEEAQSEMGKQLYASRKPRPSDPTEPTDMDPRGVLDPEYMERLKDLVRRYFS